MEIKEIPIKDIKFRENIRIKRDETSAELMNSIKQNGLLQPVGVIEFNDAYTIIWGHRRLQACKNLGWKTIPTIIFSKDEELSEDEFLIINSVENLQKKPNTLFELGRICSILRKRMSPSEIASKLSMPRGRIDSALEEFKSLPKRWHKRIKLFGAEDEKRGDIPLETASKVGRLRGLTMQQKDELLDLISKNDLTQSQTIIIASLIKNGMSIKEANKELDKFKFVQIKCVVNKEKYDKILEEMEDGKKNFINEVLRLLNKEIPGLAFKISSEGSAQH